VRWLRGPAVRGGSGAVRGGTGTGVGRAARAAVRRDPVGRYLPAGRLDADGGAARFHQPHPALCPADGLREAAAAITLPGAVRRWLAGTDLFSFVADQTSLVRRTPFAHALSLDPTADREVLLLVAQEMFRRPATRLSRARDRVVSLVPNHWMILRSPITRVGPDRVEFRFGAGARNTASCSSGTASPGATTAP